MANIFEKARNSALSGEGSGELPPRQWVNLTDEWQDVTINLEKDPIIKYKKWNEVSHSFETSPEPAPGFKKTYFLETSGGEMLRLTEIQFNSMCKELPPGVGSMSSVKMELKLGLNEQKKTCLKARLKGGTATK